jgi:hypothetical protein
MKGEPKVSGVARLVSVIRFNHTRPKIARYHELVDYRHGSEVRLTQRPLSTPILFGLTLHSRGVRVLELQPVLRAA